MNLNEYVDKYANLTFKEKKFNEIDNMIFSLLAYLDYTNINTNYKSIEEVGKEYLKTHKYHNINKLGIAQGTAYKMLEKVIETKRYKDILISDYIYNINKDIQFSAMVFHINNNLIYISFEGTDEKISGYKEDAEFACFFPVPSHIEAINYINKHVHLLGPKVIIGGHSKGGNLALVAAMYLKKYKQMKVLKVYNNDGPGLRKKEFESKEYDHIKNKYIHIVPDCSMIGILLRNDKYKVIKSTKTNILCHSMMNWVIDDDKLIETKLSEKSKRLEKSLIKWLDNHNDEERIHIINTVFNILDNYEDWNDLIKVKNIFKIIYNMSNIDKETKKLISDLLTYNFKNYMGIDSLE